MSSPTGRSPQAFQASLTARLKTSASSSGRPFAELQREFLLQRFLARVFTTPGSGWVLKGGTGLLSRLPGARHSQDIDLLHTTAQLAGALADLTHLTTIDAGDPFRFVVGEPRRQLGGVPGATVTVTAYLGARVFGGFPIDVSTELEFVAGVDLVDVASVVDVPGVGPLPPFALYPLEDQVADKVCALYARYGPDQIPSSRYKDLVDLVLIVLNFELQADQTAAALEREASRRHLRLPEVMGRPGPGWVRAFPLEARRARVPPELHLLDTALEAVGQCLDPLLTGVRRGGRWDPARRCWSEESRHRP